MIRPGLIITTTRTQAIKKYTLMTQVGGSKLFQLTLLSATNPKWTNGCNQASKTLSWAARMMLGKLLQEHITRLKNGIQTTLMFGTDKQKDFNKSKAGGNQVYKVPFFSSSNHDFKINQSS